MLGGCKHVCKEAGGEGWSKGWKQEGKALKAMSAYLGPPHDCLETNHAVCVVVC